MSNDFIIEKLTDLVDGVARVETKVDDLVDGQAEIKKQNSTHAEAISKGAAVTNRVLFYERMALALLGVVVVAATTNMIGKALAEVLTRLGN